MGIIYITKEAIAVAMPRPGEPSDEFINEFVLQLKDVLGRPVFDCLVHVIETDYLGEMKLKAALRKRPDLIERAMLSILGDAGQAILRIAWQAAKEKLNLEIESYMRRGDLARLLAPDSSNPHTTNDKVNADDEKNNQVNT